MAAIITILTDFGIEDGYVAAMKAVLLSINPKAIIVDITHQVRPQDVFRAALILQATYRYFPKGTIHLVVVDPGVGTGRKAICIKAGGYLFVGPDNGVLSLAALDCGIGAIVELTSPAYFLKQISDTFHGRDIFAPVAGHLSLGVGINNLGPKMEDFGRLLIPSPINMPDGSLTGKIIYVDRFGNLATNITEEDLQKEAKTMLFPRKKDFIYRSTIRAGTTEIKGISTSYAQTKEGQPLAIFGSAGFLEISVNRGNAYRLLGLEQGHWVKVFLPKE